MARVARIPLALLVGYADLVLTGGSTMSKPITDYVPFYRDADRAMGAVKRLLNIPCAPTPAIYFEATTSALWKIAYDIISPDVKEVYHQARGKSLYHDIKAGLEDSHILPNRDESKVTRGLFLAADLVDVAAWYMFLFGSAVDGLLDFTSQLYTAKGCQEPHSPIFFSGGPYVNAISDDGGWYPTLFEGSWGDGTEAAVPLQVLVTKGRSGMVAGSCAFKALPPMGTPAAADVAVRNDDTGIILDVGSTTTVSFDRGTMGHAFYHVKNDKASVQRISLQARYTGGIPLPLHEAFRDGDSWHGFMVDPSRIG